MVDQYAALDPNRHPALLAHSGTANDDMETRRITAANGKLNVISFTGLISLEYDNIAATYPDGTTEVYTYQSGTTPVGTTTVTYLDTNKGSLSAVVAS